MKNRKIALFITFIAVFMSVAMLLSFGAFAEGEVVKGDLTGDGKVTDADVDILMNYFASYDYDTKTSAVTLNGDADMDNSGSITLVDLVMLRAEAAANAHVHSWADATCTAPKTCTTCGATEGEALGHTWNDADCTTPKTCSVCQATEGEALGHDWADATCTAPKTCTTCGATEGEANGHAWADATCTAPKTCTTCGATEGEALGHDWADATCTAPKTCKTCGATEGEANGHDWADADCDTPKTCKTCGATEGEATGIHADNNGDYKCDGCETLMLPAANEALTIPQAIAVAKAAGTTYTTQKYYVTGVIKSVDNTTYGNMYIVDEDGNELYLYGLYSADGNTRYDAMSYKPVVGDELTVYTILGMYGTTTQGKNAWLDEVVAHEHTYSFDCDTACDICGATRETTGEHDYSEKVTDPTCTEAGFTTYTCTACGHTYTGNEVEPTGHTFVDGVCSCGAEDTAGADTEKLTLTFDNTSKRTELTTAKQVWTENGIIFTNNKGAGNDIIDSSNPVRCYKGSTITIEYPGMAQIIIYCSESKYAGGLTASAGTVTTDGNNTKITFDGTVDTVTLTASGNQVRITKIEITAIQCEHANTYDVDEVPATCTKTGTTAGVMCEDCNRVVEGVEVIPTIPHTEETIPAVDETCGKAGSTAGAKCSVCGTVTTAPTTVAPTGEHVDGDSDGTCDVCNNEMGAPAEPQSLAKFELGANGSASHYDGSEKTTYTETNNGYTLTLTSMSKVYGGARDAKGNSCLKLGTGSAAGKFSFTVGDNVTKVIIYVAKYKTNTSKVTINGTTHTLTKSSNNGEYDAIEIDTSTTKTISLTTISGGYRCMVNSIEFIGTPK